MQAKPSWPDEVVHTRTPLWLAFSLLFRDTQPYTYARVVQAMHQSGLSREELRRIFLTEVGPAFELDLPLVDSWTEDFVRRRMLRYLERDRGPAWFRWFAKTKPSATLRKRWRELLRHYELAEASGLLEDRAAPLSGTQPALQVTRGVEGLEESTTAEPEGWAETEQRFGRMGGVVQFAWFFADDDDHSVRSCIASALRGWNAEVDEPALARIAPRRLTAAEFFGSWYRPETGDLIWHGTVELHSGESLQDPAMMLLRRADIQGRSSTHGGGPGDFCRAFADPPYGMLADGLQIQVLFTQMVGFLLPPGESAAILDWYSSQLGHVSAYFEDGLEWWGAFLFTIHHAESGRLLVIAASSTD